MTELSEWIPDDRLRDWLGVERDEQTTELASLARTLGRSVIVAQSVSAGGSGIVSGGLSIGGTGFQWRTGGGADEGGRIGSAPALLDEFGRFVASFRDRWPALLVVDGPGAGEHVETLRMLGVLPGCYVVVAAETDAADGGVAIAPWPPGRLTSMLERRMAGSSVRPDLALAGIVERAAGNPRRALVLLNEAIDAGR